MIAICIPFLHKVLGQARERNSRLLTLLYKDEEAIKQLNSDLKSLKESCKPGLASAVAASFTRAFTYVVGGGDGLPKRYYTYFKSEYEIRQAEVLEEIASNVHEGLRELHAANHEVVGSALTFVYHVRAHLRQHFDSHTTSTIFRFEEKVKEYFLSKFLNLESLMKGEDASVAIAQLGILSENQVGGVSIRFVVALLDFT